MAWTKGQSGNPKGRTKAQQTNAASFARMLAEATDGGRELMRILLEEVRVGDSGGLTDKQRDRRLAVVRELLDRLFGKPQVALSIDANVGVGPALPLGALRPQDLDALEIALAPVVAEMILDEEEPRALPDPDAAPTA